jgi:hypothetical protein
MGGLVERIVPRNQTIPTAMAQDFTTYKDGQTALALHVVQGERDLVADCRSLARFELRASRPWRRAPRASASPSPSMPTGCSASARKSRAAALKRGLMSSLPTAVR